MNVIHLLLRSQAGVDIVFALCRKNQHRSSGFCYYSSLCALLLIYTSDDNDEYLLFIVTFMLIAQAFLCSLLYICNKISPLTLRKDDFYSFIYG